MWKSIVNSLFPYRCINCDLIIPDFQKFLCENCFHKLPFNYYNFGKKNPLYSHLSQLTSIEYASSLLWFDKGNITQKLLRYLKYKNLPELGIELAELWFEINKDIPKLKQIETVIPVPLHPKRLKKRGYNQIALFANRIANLLECNYDENGLVRTEYKSSQVKMNKIQREERVYNAFSLNQLPDGHYLIVDDVVTTGATLAACCNELLKNRKNKVSVLSIALV